MPGIENTYSTKYAPPTSAGKLKPRSVTIGSNAFRKACLKSTSRSESPLLRAVRMYAEPIASMIELR